MKRIVCFLLVIMLIGSAAFLIFGRQEDHPAYALLSDRVSADNIFDFSDLRESLENYSVSFDGGGKVSIYFEYLPTQTAIRINDDLESIAASLMKIPVVMSAYKLAESGKLDLDSQIPLKKEWLNSQFGTLYKEGAGYKISLREAVRLAMKDSDNTAILAIQSSLETAGGSYDDSLKFMDLGYDVSDDGRVLISARSYTSVLKCLYYSCYLSPKDSQEILGYLTESTFHNRLTAMLPKEVKVAHKIGTFSDSNQSDCGIFYLANRNYALCVYVRSADPSASSAIAEISKITYKFVENIKPEK